jgi:uncharacterized protein (DUF362 family)
MASKVALVKTDNGVGEAYRRALGLIGGIKDLDDRTRDVTIKVGIYDERNLNYPTVLVVGAVADSFSQARKILLAESDNHHGKALDRLQVWKENFSERVVPFDLSRDPNVRDVLVCGKKLQFSHVLFKPNILVSLHVLRKGTTGSIFKNLLGLVPDIRKERFHNMLGVALIDMAEAIGGINLAVIDGTFAYGGEWKEGEPMEKERRNLIVVGRDPVAVDAVGSILVGGNPLDIPAIIEARRRRLGESDINRIEIVGENLKDHQT